MYPLDQARAPRAMAWRKPGQRFYFSLTAKDVMKAQERMLLTLWQQLHMERVIAAEQYHGRINAEKFSSFAFEHFARMFKKSANPRGKLFCQDGDPSQNSVKTRYAWHEVGARKFSIPARSSDLMILKTSFILSSRGCFKMLWIFR